MNHIWLYVKQHDITGLKYFGKTTSIDPFKYKGSGKIWTRHIKKYGKDQITTIFACLYTNKEQCKEDALNFSKNNDIVNSDEWANLCFEDGITGGRTGVPCSLETKKKISESNTGKLKGRVLGPYQEDRKRVMSQGKLKAMQNKRDLGLPLDSINREKQSIQLRGNNNAPSLKLIINGVSYKSQAEASRKLNLTVYEIQKLRKIHIKEITI